MSRVLQRLKYRRPWEFVEQELGRAFTTKHTQSDPSQKVPEEIQQQV